MLICKNTPKLVVGTYPKTSGYDADIIILARNRLLETIEAVDSALNQSMISFHITVLDQGSSPAIQSEFTRLFRNHKNFGYFIAENNLGVGGGRNFLSSLGFGRVIVVLDNDAIFATDLVVAKSVKSFDEIASLGALGFKILAADGINLDEFSWGYPWNLLSRCDERFNTTTFVGAGHAVRRTTWVASGGYDPELFFTWEEYDFCLRAIALSWTIAYDGSLAVIHKISSEARVKWSYERMRFSIRNRLIIARKWNSSWISLLPRLFGYLVRATLNKRLAPTIAGILAAIFEDHSHIKATMSRRMRCYIERNETQFYGNLYERFRKQVLLKVPSDF